MTAKAKWLIVVGLLAVMTGCTDQNGPRIVRHLPKPIPAAPTPVPPAPRVEAPASPVPPPLMAPRPVLPSLRGKVVVLDAGHGGKDPGCKGVSRLPEKTIVLMICNEVARLLQARGARVVNTRTTDRFLELDERAAIAQRNKANLFVAIHADSAPRKSASGTTAFIGRSASAASLAAARSIQRAFNLASISCRGIQRANYRVLVAHSRPAVLVECGFLTNSVDASRLNNQQYRSKIAAAIARGIADYLCRG